MQKISPLAKERIPVDASAVDGLFSGLLAGTLMLVVLAVGGLLLGDRLAAILGRFDPLGLGDPLIGSLAHFSLSAIYGLIYGLLWKAIHLITKNVIPGWRIGVAFGVILFGVAQLLFTSGMGEALTGFPTPLFLLGHLVYGLVLGIAFDRGIQSPRQPQPFED